VKDIASWVKGTWHMGMLGEGFGTVQVEWGCTEIALGEKDE
nr:hypothetical protein [Tanacetum cinerariifolium]